MLLIKFHKCCFPKFVSMFYILVILYHVRKKKRNKHKDKV